MKFPSLWIEWISGVRFIRSRLAEDRPALAEHVVEAVPGQLLNPVHDQPVGDHHVADRVFIVVWDAEQICLVA